MTSNMRDYRKKDSVRELAALVRTAADATGRAAEIVLRWNATDHDEDEETRKLRLMAEDLLNGNELVARPAADRFRLEQAVVESQSLKLVCDATTGLRPIKRETVAIEAENNRLTFKLKRRGQRRRSADRR